MVEKGGQYEFTGRCFLFFCFCWMFIGSLIGIISREGGARTLTGVDGLGGDSDLREFAIAVLALLSLARLLASCILMVSISVTTKSQVYRVALVFWLVTFINFLLSVSNYRGINMEKFADSMAYFFAYDAILLFIVSTLAGCCMWMEEKFKVERTMTGSVVRTLGWTGGPSNTAV